MRERYGYDPKPWSQIAACGVGSVANIGIPFYSGGLTTGFLAITRMTSSAGSFANIGMKATQITDSSEISSLFDDTFADSFKMVNSTAYIVATVVLIALGAVCLRAGFLN